MKAELKDGTCLERRWPLTIDQGNVHIWLVNMRLPSHRFRDCNELLADEERTRARRFRFERDRRRFIVARAALRIILGAYLGLKPTHVVFSYSAAGKPEIRAALSDSRIEFNLSHSQDQCLVVLTRHCAIGADIEWIQPEFATEDVAFSFLSQKEQKRFRASDPVDRLTDFFRYWTRKEACVKALGDGISFPLRSFKAPLRSGRVARLFRANAVPPHVFRCSVYDIHSPPDYCAAVAIEGTKHTLKYLDWKWLL